MTSTTDEHTVIPATPKLDSVNNFRDIAGPGLPGYMTTGGGPLARGVFYRANRITPEPADAEILAGLNIAKVFDLRTTSEITDRPDQVPPGADYVHINIHGDEHGTIADLDFSALTGVLGKEYLVGVYRAFVTDEGQRREFANLLQQLADADGPAIFHCASGKDRTGWTAALLQSIAGVSEDDIMADYLLSNEYHQPTIIEYTENISAAHGSAAGDGINALMSVFPDTLQASFDEVATNFGSIDGYLRNGLQLPASTIDALLRKLVA
ncbi:tyrosine-protein phosphatase [Jongsikchunia kroppenstedtii]|uniref:tyrosine-protein phosphatase n=1 Tax=Jongsikchunia kroppenstedtii TaxID=1121721 RepID=UPI00036F4EC9|nr:tyrosine-protein phosphatase [Jongsikchunia kroppenstedtii]